MEPEGPMDTFPPTRMVTRGVTRQQFAQTFSSTESNLTTSSGDNTAYVASQLSSDDQDEAHSEFHMDSSADSLFRTPSSTTRVRKRRAMNEEPPSTINESANKRSARIRTAGRARSGVTRKSGSSATQEAADESSLFSLVKNGKNLHEVTDRWIEEYERHYENAFGTIAAVFYILLWMQRCCIFSNVTNDGIQ